MRIQLSTIQITEKLLLRYSHISRFKDWVGQRNQWKKRMQGQFAEAIKPSNHTLLKQSLKMLWMNKIKRTRRIKKYSTFNRWIDNLPMNCLRWERDSTSWWCEQSKSRSKMKRCRESSSTAGTSPRSIASTSNLNVTNLSYNYLCSTWGRHQKDPWPHGQLN